MSSHFIAAELTTYEQAAFAEMAGEASSGSADASSSGDPCDKHKLIGIAVVEGATEVSPGPEAPADTSIFGTVREQDAFVILEAVIDPALPGRELPEGTSVDWSGGEPVDGEPLRRRVSRDEATKVTVSATFCGDTKHAIVYIIWAEATGFRPRDNRRADDPFDDFRPARLQNMDVGIHPPDAEGRFKTVTQTEFTVHPPELIADEADGIIRQRDFKWDLYREVQLINLVLDAGEWRQLGFSEDVTGFPDGEWHDDDHSNDDEDQRPWRSGNGHIYNSDRPGMNNAQAADVTAQVMYANFREWALVGIAPEGEPRDFVRCSDQHLWYAHRTVAQDPATGLWREAEDLPAEWERDEPLNECREGNRFWGPLPPEYQDRLEAME